jgi:hypothetical protein
MRYRLLPILLLGLCCLGFGRKELPLSIRFYTEAAAGDTDSFSVPVTLLNGRRTYVDMIANISERDIVAVWPYAVQDGSGACVFKLDDHGSMSLNSLSNEKRGTILIGVINGRQACDILIDKQVTDGVVTIPNGITTDEMKLILKRFPILGSKKAAKKNKKDIYSIGL